MLLKPFQRDKMLSIKLHYFLWNAALAPVIPFLPIHAKQLGFSSVLVGGVIGASTFTQTFTRPTLGAVADKYKCQKAIFLTLQVVIAVAYIGLLFLPRAPTSNQVNLARRTISVCVDDNNGCEIEHLVNEHALIGCTLTCDSRTFTADILMNQTTNVGNCFYFQLDSTFNWLKTQEECDIRCDSPEINKLTSKSIMDDSLFYEYYQFWILFLVYVIIYIAYGVTSNILDTICFQLDDTGANFGRVRMFGPIGWGLCSILNGVLIDFLSESKVEKNFMPGFLMAATVIVGCLLVSLIIKYPQNSSQGTIAISKDFCKLLSNANVLVFIAWCMVMGACMGLTWNFLYWLLEDLTHNDCDLKSWLTTIAGLDMGIGCFIGDVPFFFLSGWILNRIGHEHTMSLVLLVAAARLSFYSIMNNPWWVLPIALLNGPTFGLLFAAMTTYANKIAPPGVETTTQGMAGAAFEGVGISVGCLVGGELFKRFDGSFTFLVYGGMAGVACILHISVQWVLKVQDKKKMLSDTSGTHAKKLKKDNKVLS